MKQPEQIVIPRRWPDTAMIRGGRWEVRPTPPLPVGTAGNYWNIFPGHSVEVDFLEDTESPCLLTRWLLEATSRIPAGLTSKYVKLDIIRESDDNLMRLPSGLRYGHTYGFRLVSMLEASQEGSEANAEDEPAALVEHKLLADSSFARQTDARAMSATQVSLDAFRYGLMVLEDPESWERHFS